MPRRSIEQILNAPGPKKILACDGGGIRGVISIEILARIEAELREQTGNPDLLLGDWFDFVCGTSTGAIMATCIACGMSTAQIREFYIGSGELMFDKASLLRRLKYKFDSEPLAQMLRTELNRALGYAEDAPPACFGDERLGNLLMLVLRNHSTNSPWPLCNNPRAKYNAPDLPDCNLDLPLWQLVRGSTAAPTFFPPEVVTLGEGSDTPYDFVFVDGGVTTYNNPAFLAFQMVTAAPYHINWETGADKLLIVSVGTGVAMETFDANAGSDSVLESAIKVPSALMDAATAGWDMACRVLGDCRFGPRLDGEVGDMVSRDGSPTSTVPGQFSYVRYNPGLDASGLAELGLTRIDPSRVQSLDSVASIPELQAIGQAYAREKFSIEHLRGFI